MMGIKTINLLKALVRRFNAANKSITLLAKSQYFNAEWYLNNNPDVARAGIDPVRHYLRYGAQEGREPGPLFDTQYYTSQISELPATQRKFDNPLVHFLTIGQRAGLRPFPPSGLDGNVKINTRVVLPGREVEVSVIIPVFNAVEELRDCLNAVVEYTYFPCRVILINDASCDTAVSALLDKYRSYEYFEVYHNSVNLGFSGTVNKGLELSGECDVVLLNADTVVTPGWLGRLRETAYRQDNIGTVTPVSNNAGAFTVPEAGQNNFPSGFSTAQIGRLITQNSKKQYPIVPTGNGFCLYIKRACIQEVGGFDAEAFPRGYGEENDFCMRALEYGWKHVIDDATWIYHVRSASFGEDKNDLIQQGRKIIDERYPYYGAIIKKAFSAEKVMAVKECVAQLYTKVECESECVRLKPRVLYVLSTLTGGTPQTNRDLMSALSEDIDAYVLYSDSQTLKLHGYSNDEYKELARVRLQSPVNVSTHRSDEYDRVVKIWLSKWAIELIHIRHIAFHSVGLVDVAKLLGIPCLFSFHDFYTICPSVKLLDSNLDYCGGHCTTGEGLCEYELWPEGSFESLKYAQIKPWKRRFLQFLELCSGFVTTNPQAKELILEHFPEIANNPFEVIAHGRDFKQFHQLATPPKAGRALKLLILGNISPAKGGYLIQTLAQEISSSRLEIHILGGISPELKFPDSVICHGVYERDELTYWMKKIQPNLGAVLSIWPETWCHTLTEYWAHGIPVVGFNIGAVGQRLGETEGGWLIDITDVGVLKKTILGINEDDWNKKVNAVMTWQKSVGTQQTCDSMAKAYWSLYQSTWRPLAKKLKI